MVHRAEGPVKEGPPKIPLEEFMQAEARFRGPDPERSRRLREAAAEAARRRWELYRHLAGLTVR